MPFKYINIDILHTVEPIFPKIDEIINAIPY